MDYVVPMWDETVGVCRQRISLYYLNIEEFENAKGNQCDQMDRVYLAVCNIVNMPISINIC